MLISVNLPQRSLHPFTALDHVLDLSQKVVALFVLLLHLVSVLFIGRNQFLVDVLDFADLSFQLCLVLVEQASLLEPALIRLVHFLYEFHIVLLVFGVIFDLFALELDDLFESL
jgi:hypothetical protein